MKYLGSKDLQGLQQYLLEKEYLDSIGVFSENISDDVNEEFNRKKITTKIDVDFFTEQVKIYLVFPPRSQKKKKQLQEETGNIQTEIYSVHEEDKPSNRLIIDKQFKISDDFESVSVDGKIHLIPAFFDKKSIVNQDMIVWEMIFYKIFYEEINKNINKKES